MEAKRRLDLLTFALTVPGGWPGRAAAVAVEIARRGSPLAACGPAPDRSTLSRWAANYAAAGQSLGGLIPKPSTGRPPKDITGALAEHLRAAVRASNGQIGHTPLHALAETFCRAKGVPCPTYAAVRRFRRSMPVPETVLSEFGTQAARALTAPKAERPTRHANELVYVDETLLPTWMRVWHDERRDWLKARPWGVFAVDAHSRYNISHWVKEPDASTPETRLHSHFSHLEVLGVVAAAVLPELAHPDDRESVRGEPDEFRLDGSGNTKAARAKLVGVRVAASLGEANAPWVRGRIERFFRTLKKRDLIEIFGHANLYVPFDPTADDPRTLRGRTNADAKRRTPVKHEVPVLSLPDIEQVRALVRWAVAKYNDSPSRALRGRAPASVWLKTAPDRRDRPSAIPSLFPEHRLTVDPRGVEVNNEWYNSPTLQHAYPPRTTVLVRGDPLERGVYVYPLAPALRSRTPALFVERRTAWARTLEPEAFVKETRAQFKQLSAAVTAERERFIASQIGPEAQRERQADIAERARRQDRVRRKLGPTVTADGDDTTVPRGGTPSPTGGAAERVAAPPEAATRPRRATPRTSKTSKTPTAPKTPAQPPAGPPAPRAPLRVLPFQRRPARSAIRLVEGASEEDPPRPAPGRA